MGLKPEVSIGVGLATAGVVYAIHTNFTPTMADIQALPAGNADIDRAERQATWASIGAVSAISLLTKDATVLVLGSLATVGMAFLTRHANWTETLTGGLGAAMPVGPGQDTMTDDGVAGPQMADSMAYTMFGRSEFVSG